MLFSRKIARAFLTDSTLTDFRQIVEEAKNIVKRNIKSKQIH